jgi:hypothetical protein
MVPSRLRSRLKFVKATPLKNRAQTTLQSRRGKNYVVMDEDDMEFEKYDTFFDYEEELADLKPSSEQYSEMNNSDPFVMLEDNESEQGSVVMEETSSVTMEESESFDSTLVVENKENKKYTDVVGFEFIQCDFTKADGNRCKRQAPKGSTICSTHKRYIDKNKLD